MNNKVLLTITFLSLISLAFLLGVMVNKPKAVVPVKLADGWTQEKVDKFNRICIESGSTKDWCGSVSVCLSEQYAFEDVAANNRNSNDAELAKMITSCGIEL